MTDIHRIKKTTVILALYDQNELHSKLKIIGHFGLEITTFLTPSTFNRFEQSVDPNRPSTFTNEIKLTCRCISPRFSTTFVLVNLIFFEYLLAFLKKKIMKNLEEIVEFTKIQKFL